MRQTTDEQLEEIWSRASEGDICPNADRTTDQWGNQITLFDSWSEVEAMADIVYAVLPQEFTEDNAPAWLHLPEERRGNPRHHIEWAIGDYGFKDQYTTCSHCYVAIDTQDYDGPRYWYDTDLGEIICDGCIKSDSSFAGDYLSYCARHLGHDDGGGEIANHHFTDPSDHGYICINPYTAYGEYAYGDFLIKYEGIPNFPMEDHPDYNGFLLDYADSNRLRLLRRAIQSIDPNLQMICQSNPKGYGAYLYWAKFETEQSEDGAFNLSILQYAIGRVFAKLHDLYLKGSK